MRDDKNELCPIYLGLVHHPIKNKNGQEVTTSVTNLDIHDIARSVKTFGLKKYFIVTPILKQQSLVKKILGHWETDDASDYNPDRCLALSDVQVVSSVEEAMSEIELRDGQRPSLCVTGANFKTCSGDVTQLLKWIKIDNRPCLLLFGTGWGLHESLLQQSDFTLAPIYGDKQEGYNHLSVRSAVAVYLSKICDQIQLR